MKNLLVVLSDKNEIALSTATNNLPSTEVVLRLSRTTWRIDPHKSFSFLGTLLGRADEHNITVSVYEIEDILQEGNPV